MDSTKKRFNIVNNSLIRDHQLSGLFNIITNNLLTATSVLGSGYESETIQELEQVSKKAQNITKQLSSSEFEDDFSERVSNLKAQLLHLINSLTEELNKLEISTNKKAIEDILLARKLLRDSQRGLATL